MDNDADAIGAIAASRRGRPDPVIWTGPGNFGEPAAFEAKTGVAAPLLAGFSLTLLGVVAQAPASFRWPGATMTMLAVAVFTLAACVQFGFRGRAVLYSQADVHAWGRLSALDPGADERLRVHVQARDMAEWWRWHHRSRVTYNAAIVALAVGVALVFAPPATYVAGHPLARGESAWRWGGMALSLLAAALEASWIAADAWTERRRLSTPATPDETEQFDGA